MKNDIDTKKVSIRKSISWVFALMLLTVSVSLSAMGQEESNSPSSPLSGGSLDQTFTAVIGLTGSVNAITVQADGKAVIAGNFTFVNTAYRNRVARLNIDGSVDTSFDPGIGPNGVVYDVEVLPSAKVLIVGQFTQVSGIARNGIARLNIDGSVDPSFAPAGSNNTIRTIALDSRPDGKVMIGGDFGLYNGVSRPGIARLLENGDLDISFVSPAPGYSVTKIIIQPDNKILAGGPLFGIRRLNDNGSLDTGFSPNVFVGGAAIALLANGQILVGGSGVARLNSNGIADQTFSTATNNAVGDIIVQPNGQIVIAGGFTTVNGVPRNGVARLNANGGLDDFNPALNKSSASSSPAASGSIALRGDGRILIGGLFNFPNEVKWNSIAQFYSNGTIDASFNCGVTDHSIADLGGSIEVNQVRIQPDGKVLASGRFNSANGAETNMITRFNIDGSLDSSFSLGAEADDTIYAMAIDSQGRILIGGEFRNVNGQTRNRIARLLPDGTLDASFNPPLGPNNNVDVIAIDSQDRIVIGGLFTSVDGATRNRIARLNTNGSNDASFTPGSGSTGGVTGVGVFALAIQSDGQIVIGGQFTRVNNVSRTHVARLDSTGVLDLNFNPTIGTSTGLGVFTMALDTQNRIVIGGLFGSISGTARRNIARLANNGSVDTSFSNTTNSAVNARVFSIMLQPDGNVLIGGEFTEVYNVDRNHIARLNTNGLLDQSFDVGTGANQNVNTITLQGNNVIIGGRFTVFNGIHKGRVARLFGTGTTTHSVGGSVQTPDGRGLRNASVSIIDSLGVKQTVTTSSFGVYTLGNIRAGETYTISVSSKRYRFVPRVLQLSGDLTNINFVGLE